MNTDLWDEARSRAAIEWDALGLDGLEDYETEFPTLTEDGLPLDYDPYARAAADYLTSQDGYRQEWIEERAAILVEMWTEDVA